MAFPQTKLDTVVELLLGGQWTDITSDVMGDGKSAIVISQGRDDGTSNLQPSSATFTLKNATKYGPKNANSPYYGLIGLNTPVRIFMRPHLSGVLPRDVYDLFTRTETSSWGTSTSGDTYGYYGSGGTIATTDWTVDGTRGIQWVPTASAYRVAGLNSATCRYTDVEVRATVDTYISSVAGGAIELGGIVLRSSGLSDGYLCRLDVAPGGAMTASVLYPHTTTLASATVSTFTWSGQELGVRARIIGNTIEYKVWDNATTEPAAWSLRYVDDSITASGEVQFRSGVATGNTNTKPIEFRWDNIYVYNISPRFYGEISEWPIVSDITGRHITCPITANGIKRRLNQGAKTARSPLYRFTMSNSPLCYWPLTGGAESNYGGTLALGFPGMGLIAGPTQWGQVDGPSGAPEKLPELANNINSYDVAFTLSPTVSSGTSYTIDFISRVIIPSSAAGSAWSGINTIVWYDTVEALWSLHQSADLSIPSYTTELAGPGFTLTFTENIMDGFWHHFRIEVDNTVSPTKITFLVDNVLYATTTSASVTPAPLSYMLWQATPRSVNESFSIGHVTLYSGCYKPVSYPAFCGHAGDTISTRCARLATQDSTAIDVIDDGSSSLLCTQRTVGLVDLLNDIQHTDQGIIYESMAKSGLVYRALNDLYNQSALAIDFSTHIIGAELNPVYNDRLVWNDVVVQRYLGQNYQHQITAGPRGSATIGTYDRGQLDIYPLSDATNPYIAQWIALNGTVDEYRYPGIFFRLSRAAIATNHTLFNELLTTELGNILQITNLPSWLPSNPPLCMVQGYQETLSQFDMTLNFVTTPASPYYNAGVVGIQRVGADGDMVLASALTTSSTSAYVKSLSGDSFWCRTDNDAESSSDYPMPIDIGGEFVTASACGYVLSDAFTRTASSWGTADTGQTWTQSSTGTFSVASPYGTILPTTNSAYITGRTDMAVGNDMQLSVSMRMPNLTFTSTFRIGAVVRFSSTTNNYLGYLSITTAGVITITLAKYVSGSTTVISTKTPGITYVAGDLWHLKIQVLGTLIRMKAWKDGMFEPTWQLSTTDTSLTSGTYVGLMARNDGTTVVAQADFTNLVVQSPQKLTVARSANHAVAHAANSVVEPLYPAHVAL